MSNVSKVVQHDLKSIPKSFEVFEPYMKAFGAEDVPANDGVKLQIPVQLNFTSRDINTRKGVITYDSHTLDWCLRHAPEALLYSVWDDVVEQMYDSYIAENRIGFTEQLDISAYNSAIGSVPHVVDIQGQSVDMRCGFYVVTPYVDYDGKSWLVLKLINDPKTGYEDTLRIKVDESTTVNFITKSRTVAYTPECDLAGNVFFLLKAELECLTFLAFDISNRIYGFAEHTVTDCLGLDSTYYPTIQNQVKWSGFTSMLPICGNEEVTPLEKCLLTTFKEHLNCLATGDRKSWDNDMLGLGGGYCLEVSDDGVWMEYMQNKTLRSLSYPNYKLCFTTDMLTFTDVNVNADNFVIRPDTYFYHYGTFQVDRVHVFVAKNCIKKDGVFYVGGFTYDEMVDLLNRLENLSNK